MEVRATMQIALLHLSDIHFTTARNPIGDRVQQIASAFHSITPTPDCCLVAVTGDIAFSGTQAEYGQASAFFRLLEISLKVNRAATDVWFTFVPREPRL